ncbi:MAG TPA: flagellar hook-basal body complex protein FliE [Rhodospirillaceae bacterium]|nr:flagellar hook-basal body complex protein FliE [Rhodospirillaceae bacterium]
MAINSITDAIAAYNTAAKSVTGAGSGGDAAATEGAGPDFASMLKEGVNAAIDASKKSEELSKQAITGKADVRDVVAAVNNAEMTLQTVVAVRDKVISAYNDILRMPI